MLITLRIPVRPLFWLGIISLVLVFMWPQHALGRIESCRRDPIVWLSNGRAVQMTAVIGTAPEDVRSVIYILRVPKGLTMTRIVYQGNAAMKASEDVRFFADQPPNSFTIATVVTTVASGVAVTAKTRMGPLMGSVNGLSHQKLIVKLQTTNTLPSPSAIARPTATSTTSATTTPIMTNTPVPEITASSTTPVAATSIASATSTPMFEATPITTLTPESTLPNDSVSTITP